MAHQLLEERTRVTYVMDSIESKDPNVLAALASIRQDNPGMRDNFEQAAAFLLPACPIAKKGASRKGISAQVAAVNPQLNTGKGKTGVELCWYPQK